MTDIDYVVPCPYCRRPSTLIAGNSRDGPYAYHHCQYCGGREESAVQTVMGWARHEALHARVLEAKIEAEKAGDLRTAGLLSEALGGSEEEPVARDEDGVWFGLWSGTVYDLPPVPEGECDRFASEYDRYHASLGGRQ